MGTFTESAEIERSDRAKFVLFKDFRHFLRPYFGSLHKKLFKKKTHFVLKCLKCVNFWALKALIWS
jgi:hypothetical protein